MENINSTLEEYFQALERLIKNRPIIIVKGRLIGIRSRSGIDVALTTTDKSNPKKIVPQPGPSRNLSEPPTQAAIIAIILPTKIKPADIIRIGLIGGGKLYID